MDQSTDTTAPALPDLSASIQLPERFEAARLTKGERLMLLQLLAGQGRILHVTDLYTAMKPPGFTAGFGGDGVRPNVRAAIKRIRSKLSAIGIDATQIVTQNGLGYRWIENGEGDTNA